MSKFWVFMIFLAAAGIWDGRTKRIPNWLIFAGAVAGVLLGGVGAAGIVSGSGAAVPGIALEGGALAAARAPGVRAIVAGAALPALQMLAAVVPGLALYRFRVVGAGDVKLAAVIVGVMGFGAGGAGIFAGLCLGAVWSLARMVRRGIMRKRFLYLMGYVRRALLTGKIEAYYDRRRDGEEEVIPLGVCLAVGAAAVMILIECKG